MKRRILWLSNSPHSRTGYGVQTNVVYDLQAAGYEILGQAFFGVQGAPVVMNGIMWLPGVKDAYGNDMFVENYKMADCNLMISLIDAWVLNPHQTSQIRWIPYMPVDCHPLPVPIINSIRTAYRIFSYSRFGEAELKRFGFDSYYIPHFVDSKDFYPMDAEQKAAARRVFNIPDDAFVIAIVAANKGAPSRKAFDAQLRAIGEFMIEHPNTHVILHTDVWGGYNGEPIDYLVQYAKIPMDNVHTPNFFQFHNGMYGQDYMNALYNTADVLMNMTRGEGFGVPIIEAAAAGTPVIVTEHSAMTELGHEANGWVVKPDAEIFIHFGFFAVPSVKGGAEALRQAYREKQEGSLKERAMKGREIILKNYERKHVVNHYWLPILEEVYKGIEEREKFILSLAAKGKS